MSQLSLRTPSGGTINITAEDTAASKTLTLPAGDGNIATVDMLSNRNKIINGKMEIAQRGTSFTLDSAKYMLDRWRGLNSTSAILTAAKSTDTPSDEYNSSFALTVTTADASVAAGDFVTIGQAIEGYNVRDLIGRDFTLSFWVRSAKTGTHCVTFRNLGLDRTYVAEYTVNTADTWEKKTITVSAGLITAGTWDWENGYGLSAYWSLTAGTTYQTTANTWQTGNFFSTTNQVNVCDTVNNIFAITGVQLEAGSVATPFEHRSYANEQQLCRRYYQAWGAFAAGAGSSSKRYASTSGFGWHIGQIQHEPIMRAAPTWSTSTPIYWNCSDLDAVTAPEYTKLFVNATAAGSYTATSFTTYLDAEL